MFEFDELEHSRTNPLTGERLYNYWGYSTVGFFAPKAGYAATGQLGMQADEFKPWSRSCTGTPSRSFSMWCSTTRPRATSRARPSPSVASTTAPTTCSPPMASITTSAAAVTPSTATTRSCATSCSTACATGWRNTTSMASASTWPASWAATPTAHRCPTRHCWRPWRSTRSGKTKLIAEAWDAGGLYQVGTFPAYGRWAEWNGKYRDCVRKFLKGDMGQVGDMAQRLWGRRTCTTRGPTASVNFVTCHDGFTLADLVSYNHKHNEANGEENRDGADDNQSWNGGVEGPTDDPQILALRRRQIKNALTMLMLSQGVPMLLMGDEIGRTQQGNNNAYCQDSPLTWLDWSLQERNAELFRFCQGLIAFRQRHPALRQASHASPGSSTGDALQVTWHGTRAWLPDWAPHSRVLACLLSGAAAEGPDVLYVAMNMYWEALAFELPSPPPGQRWHIFANTAMAPPADIWEPGQEPPLPEQQEVLLEGPGDPRPGGAMRRRTAHPCGKQRRVSHCDESSSRRGLGLLQIMGIKALGEPAIDLCAQLPGRLVLPWRCQSRLRLMAARSSNAFACWRLATSMAFWKQASAWGTSGIGS